MSPAIPARLLTPLLLLVCTLPAAAQDTTGTSGKLNPSFTAPVSIPVSPAMDDSTKSGTRPLPKFDLPEFVITGTSVIDLPDGEKQSPLLRALDAPPLSAPTNARDRAPDVQPDQLLQSPPALRPTGGLSGGVEASVGTYFSPELRGWIGNADPSMSVHAGAGYRRTAGWMPYSDRSGADVRAGAEVPVQSSIPLLDQGVVRAGGAYTFDQYQFYGSLHPDVHREVSDLNLAFGFRNFTVAELPFDIALVLGNTVVQDSSTGVHQQAFGLNIRSVFDAEGLPVDLEFGVSSASLSDQLTAHLSSFHIGATTRWLAAPSLVLTGGAAVWSLQGMGGQNTLRVLPRIRAEYSGTPVGMVYAAFEPDARFVTLRTLIDQNPYVLSRSDIKHANDTQKWLIGAETRWFGALRTVVEVSYTTTGDRSIPIDSASAGVWTIRYEDVRTLKGVATAVAKFTANDYFACGLTMRSVRGSVSGTHVPYEPSLEADVWHEHHWTGRLATSAGLKFCSRRDAVPTGNVQLPSCVLLNARASYEWLKNFRVFVEGRNLADQKIVWWRNYPDRPFSLFIGLTVNW